MIPLADYELLTDLGATGDHAGVFETALLLPDRPDLVHLEIEGDLPGVIGDDPRGRATPELGERGARAGLVRAAAALLERALVEPREPIAEALAAAVEALERPLVAPAGPPARGRPPGARPPPGSTIWSAFREGRLGRTRLDAAAVQDGPIHGLITAYPGRNGDV